MDGTEYIDLEPRPSGSSLLDLVRLTSWARGYQAQWRATRTGRLADVVQLVRRYVRLRAGILDILQRSKPEQVRTLLLQVGLEREALPDDLAVLLDYPKAHTPLPPRIHRPTGDRTVPIARKPS